MATYSVMALKSAESAIADAVLVREGFRFWAAALGPLWLAYHRNWRALAGWLLIFVMILVLWGVGFLHAPSMLWLVEAIALFLGVQGQSLIEAALQRRRYEVIDVVTGDSLREAERIFFRRAVMRRQEPPRPAVSTGFAPPSDAIIGLFPMSEVRS